MRRTNHAGGGYDVTARAQHDRPSGSGGVCSPSSRQTGAELTDGATTVLSRR